MNTLFFLTYIIMLFHKGLMALIFTEYLHALLPLFLSWMNSYATHVTFLFELNGHAVTHLLFTFLSVVATPAGPSTTAFTAPQHGSTVPVTGIVTPRSLPCFEGMDMSACPADGCQEGLYCNGRQCVRKNECPCLIDGQVVQVNVQHILF